LAAACLIRCLSYCKGQVVKDMQNHTGAGPLIIIIECYVQSRLATGPKEVCPEFPGGFSVKAKREPEMIIPAIAMCFFALRDFRVGSYSVESLFN
jgi:hypothetical protein